MAATTFTWVPTYGASKSVEPVVRVIKMGDGYEQRQAPGIKRQARQYSLTFRVDSATAGSIDTFLAARGALEAFNYTHPGDPSGVFVCRRWNRADVDKGVDEISATFDEVFE